MKRITCMWKNPVTNKVYVLGTLTYDNKEYSFTYTDPDAVKKWIATGKISNHTCLSTDCEHPLVTPIQTSPHLFFWCSNRLMHKSRPDYDDYIKRMDLDPNTATDLDILERTPHHSIYSSRHFAFRPTTNMVFFLDISVEEINLAIGDKFTVDTELRVWDTHQQLVGRIPWHWQDLFVGGEELSVVKRNDVGPLNMRLLCKLG